MSIALFAATDLEFRALASMLARWQPGKVEPLGGIGWCGENRIELFRTAMGPHNAATQAERALSSTDATMVLVSGLAGGLAPECRIGDLVLYRHCHLVEDKEVIAGTIGCDRIFTDRLRDRLQAAQMRLHEGAGLTAPRVICRAAEKQQAGLRYQAIAVDMESYQILSVAEKSGSPSAVLRAISDDSEHDLPDLNAGLNGQAEPNNFKMLLSLGAHPLLATRFLLNLWRALERLKQALFSVLSRALPEVSRL